MSRRRLLIGGGGMVGAAALVMAALIAIQLLRSDDPGLAEEAPAIGTTGAGAPFAAAGVRHYVVDAAASSAKYVVREKLRNLPVSTNAVGETSAISGDLYLTDTGPAPSPASRFRVDLRTLRSDESRRDSYIRDNTLQAGLFPSAEFTIESVTGYPAASAEGTEFAASLVGSMTIHNVTKPLTWQVKARRQGDTLTATADSDFKMTDFGITPPDVVLAKAEDGVHLQVVLVARLRAGA